MFYERSRATKKKMTWKHFRVLKWRIFIRVEKREHKAAGKNSSAFSERVRARDTSLTRYLTIVIFSI